jgi:hypothetical protein
MTKTWIALALAAAGCMTGPENGTFTDQNVVGKSFHFGGYFNEPNEFIYVEILKEPTLDPTNNGNWAGFTAVKTGTDPVYINSDVPLYSWSVNATPVPANADATIKKRWPQGGVARVRAFHIGDDGERELLTTFDAVTSACLGQSLNDGDEWQVIGTKCEGLGDKSSILVSTSPLPSTHTPFLSDKGSSNSAFTYYAFGQTNAPDTLTAFRNRYGFNSAPSQVVSARYYNDGDLGLGREMNCKSFAAQYGLGVACYVRNYSGYSGQNAFAAGLAEKSSTDVLNGMINNGHAPFATVAMVFVPPAGQPDSVRFMVYDAAGELTDKAQLDYAGDNDSIPNNCLSCHGIDSTTNNLSVDGKAEFLPFDPFAFKFSSQSPYRLSDQQDEFRKLNLLVKLTSPPAATNELITGLYAPKSVSDSTAVATNKFMPADWKPNNTLDGEALYNGVIKPFCRTCHISSNNATLDFNDWSDVKDRAAQIRGVVCGTKKMPHAERVQKKFWQSGARAYVLTGLGASGADSLAACKP